MPELPEVETTRRGVAPLLTGRAFTGAVLRQPRLRWPIDPELAERLAGRRVSKGATPRRVVSTSGNSGMFKRPWLKLGVLF